MNAANLAKCLKGRLSKIDLENLARKCGLTIARHNKTYVSNKLSHHLLVTYLKEQVDCAERLLLQPDEKLKLGSIAGKLNKASESQLETYKVVGSSLPKSIISIDVGIKNLAYVHMTCSGKILDWKTFSLNLESSKPKDFIEKLLPIVHQVFLPKQFSSNCDDNRETVDMFIIERQSFRQKASAHLINVMIVESMLFALLSYKNHKKVQSSSPLVVNGYLDMIMSIEDDSINKKQHYLEGIDIAHWLHAQGKKSEIKKYLRSHKRTKKLSKLLVDYWIKDHPNLCSEEFSKYFSEAEKKDDLADCFIQGLVYLSCKRSSILEAYRWILEQ
ncbi:10382_t:CDS:2 [Acaulospora morrowiae]|uniref:10382_t:CDS:1 n=1 Tax=Acaulospora morrowiae TaxID=94023 RepID=A0A9N8WP72_9GLOM|nr:10382_t:CDS:2 [Acaulospora morrowiae]